MFSPILSLLSPHFFFDLPDLTGWLGWFLLLGLLVWVSYRWRNYHREWDAQAWLLFGAFLLAVPLSSLFIGIRIPGPALNPSDLPIDQLGPAILFFSAIPWVLAASMLGPIPAAILALSAGALRGLFDTHSIFQPLVAAGLALTFSILSRQQYRTRIFSQMRQPWAASLLLVPIFVPIAFISIIFEASGMPAERIDFALNIIGPTTLVFTSEILVAGVVAQIIISLLPKSGTPASPLIPSPIERSLETRFVAGAGTLIGILLLALLLGNWFIAGRAARQMLQDRLSSTAQVNSEIVPFYLETGRNLAAQISREPALLNTPGAELNQTLAAQMQALPFFDQLYLVNADLQALSGYPQPAHTMRLEPSESDGVLLAFAGVLSQDYTIPPQELGEIARVSFIITLHNPTGQIERVLIAHSNLENNPLTQPVIESLSEIETLNGVGLLLDGENRILYHPSRNRIMSIYQGTLSPSTAFYDDTDDDGKRILVYHQPVAAHGWSILLIVPAQQAQQLAVNIAAPLALMILALGIIALPGLRYGLRTITTSLRLLSDEAGRIAKGELDHPLPVVSIDEIGQLRRSFEQMRAGLHARMDELNRLLAVSQGVASSLEMKDAVQPVLEAVMGVSGASAVRVVLLPVSPSTEIENITAQYSIGPMRDAYEYLDQSLLSICQKRDQVIYSSLSRASELAHHTGKQRPGALLATALKHKDRFYGVLWAAYDRPRQFHEDDLRFLTTISGHAALAAANTYLFQSAEVGRQRLEAILASTPDPVLVTDQKNCLMLANPAACQLLGLSICEGQGKPIGELLQNAELLAVLQNSVAEQLSVEVNLAEQVYLATASDVLIHNQSVGRVCILRDITHFKQLDAMKSDFVATVSHDLRSPLTLIRGYATMLETLGELNEQQHGYVRKIIVGVENMAGLINNLLDLARIEAGVGLQTEAITAIDIVDRVTSSLQPQASAKSIQIEVQLARDMPRIIHADPALLQQALYNVVENAIKYSSEQGKVILRVKAVENNILFEIEDSGIGILPEDQKHLFDRFFRSSQRDARAQKGSGLGLTIVRSIAQQHGGKVWLQSRIGVGSTFYLQIPIRHVNGQYAV